MGNYMKTNKILIHLMLWIGFQTLAGQAAEPYSRRTPVVEAFEKNKNAVVSISSKYVTEIGGDGPFRSWGWDEWPFRRKVEVPSLGSGFVIDDRGYIVTNAHVVQQAEKIDIGIADGSVYQARKVALDPSADLALLKIEADKSIPTVKMGRSDDLMIGETVLAIGNPFGYQHTLTDGIISAIHREIELGNNLVMPDLIQISVPINPGNSGGPLININGELIGINTAIRKAAQGIGFAIPVGRLQENLPVMLNQIIEKKLRINFGMTVCDIKKTQPGNQEKGALVWSVHAESPADKADIQVGDLIMAVNEKKILTAIDFYLEMLEQKEDAVVQFDVQRSENNDENRKNVKNFQTSLTLRRRPQPDGVKLAQEYFGMKLGSLTRRLIERYQINGKLGSVVVLKVENSSQALRSGIKAGDVLLAIDNSQIQNVEQVGLKLENMQTGDKANFLFSRTRTMGNSFQIVEQYYRTLEITNDQKSVKKKKKYAL